MSTPLETLAAHLLIDIIAITIKNIRDLLARENWLNGTSSISRDEWEMLFLCVDTFYAELCRWTDTPEAILLQTGSV